MSIEIKATYYKFFLNTNITYTSTHNNKYVHIISFTAFYSFPLRTFIIIQTIKIFSNIAYTIHTAIFSLMFTFYRNHLPLTFQHLVLHHTTYFNLWYCSSNMEMMIIIIIEINVVNKKKVNKMFCSLNMWIVSLSILSISFDFIFVFTFAIQCFICNFIVAISYMLESIWTRVFWFFVRCDNRI